MRNIVALVATVTAVLLVAGARPELGGQGSSRAATGKALGFTFTAVSLPERVRRTVTGRSWRKGCPVALSGLRYLTISYWDFDGRRRVGSLIVNRDAVRAMRTAFGILYRWRFPIRRMRLVDTYGASDSRSIDADNTSAFNCRLRTGGGGWSEHAFGRAVDVNPIENPYVAANGTTVHRASRPFLRRRPYRPGMAVNGGILVRAFADAGWKWGGAWSVVHDYQHFSASGR